MDRKSFNSITQRFVRIIKEINPNNKKWTFLTSIEYMLNSKLYLDSIFIDLNLLDKFASREDKILDFGTGCGFLATVLTTRYKHVFAIDTKNYMNFYLKGVKLEKFLEDAKKQVDV